MKRMHVLGLFLMVLLFASCSSGVPTPAAPAEAPESFTLWWSEYPSWSVYGVAGETKVNGELLIDGRKGVQGSMEKKWNVDIVLKEADYDGCIVAYGAGQADAVCITNMDILAPSLSKKAVAIMPSSTSYGADQCIASKDITNVEQLKGKKIYGLAKSVSEYCFVRNLELVGQKEKDYKFTNMDPGAAATAMQQGQAEFQAIMVWNPFCMQTLATRKDSHTLFSSESIPGEIIDMVVMSQESLDRRGGKQAACCIIDTKYTICKMLADAKRQDDMLVHLGEKFSKLDAEQMKTVVRQTRFYATADQALAVFTGGSVFPWQKTVKDTSSLFTNEGFKPDSQEVSTKTLKEVMPLVVEFCVSHEIVPKAPTIGYGSKDKIKDVQLRFDPSYIQEVKNKK